MFPFDDVIMFLQQLVQPEIKEHKSSALQSRCEYNQPVNGGFPLQRGQ